MVPPVGLEPTHSLRSERSDFIQFAHRGIINTVTYHWESRVIRLLREQENAGSNPAW